jgi:catechol 2,3-dioxygenase-like lactoylglutathione lyase family enzyme
MTPRALGVLVLFAALAPGQAPAPAVPLVGIPVSDLPASVAFYRDVLGFRELDATGRDGAPEERLQGVFGLRTESARLRLGEEVIELTEFLAPRGRPVPADSRSDDRWFQHLAIVVRDMDRAYDVLRRHRVAHSSPRPQTLPASNPAAGGIRAFYFRDPDDHPLEILWFPADKGDPRWRRPGDDLFLGIDHTAIVVADTEASLRVWRDALGFRVAGASDNYGEEQERLNAVFGARLRITTLRGYRGPGVELLEYVSPGGGRPMPRDTAASDLWAWTIGVEVADVGSAGAVVRASGGSWISPGAIERGEGASAVPHLLVRDPDGHRALLRAAPAR